MVPRSSRSLTYNPVPLGRGTPKVDPAKPSGTGSALLKLCVGGDGVQQIQIRSLQSAELVLSARGSATLSGRQADQGRERLPVSVSPLAEMARKRNGPKAEGPKLFSGSSDRQHGLRILQREGAVGDAEKTWTDSSSVAISIFSSRGNVCGNLRLQRERKLRVLRQLILAFQLNR